MSQRPLRLRDITLAEAAHHSLVLGWLRNLWRKRLTPAGRACVWLMLLFGLNGAVSMMLPLYIPWSFFFVLLVVSRLSTRSAVAGLSVTRSPVSPVPAGRTLTYQVEVTNHSSRPRYDLEVAEWALPFSIRQRPRDVPEVVRELGPGEKIRVRMKLLCRKRGAYTLPRVAVMSAFPLGVWRGVVRRRQETSFLVYPAFQSLETFDVPHSRQYQPGGILLSSQVGDSAEFMHTREYREGDNPRHIHWPSWARQGKPIVKVYQEEYFVRLALLLDCEWPDRRNDESFEAGVSLAASIADVLSRQDFIIDLFAAGDAIHHFQAGRALAHLENILEILACVEATDAMDWDRLLAALIPQSSQFSAMALVLLDWDEARKAMVERLQSLGVSIRVLVMRDGDTTLPMPASEGGAYVRLRPDEDLTQHPSLGGRG